MTIASMSGGELGEILDGHADKGLELTACYAVADIFAGPFEVCDGIKFLRTRDDLMIPGWIARATHPS